jgi:hypothetical protein
MHVTQALAQGTEQGQGRGAAQVSAFSHWWCAGRRPLSPPALYCTVHSYSSNEGFPCQTTAVAALPLVHFQPWSETAQADTWMPSI